MYHYGCDATGIVWRIFSPHFIFWVDLVNKLAREKGVLTQFASKVLVFGRALQFGHQIPLWQKRWLCELHTYVYGCRMDGYYK